MKNRTPDNKTKSAAQSKSAVHLPTHRERRLRVGIWLLLLLGCLTQGYAATDVCGIVGGVWTTNGSPYLVTCDILVTNLTIEPGVEVRFEGGYEFQVINTLHAQGTADRPVWFHPASGQAWKGIFFNGGSGGSEMVHCRIEGSTESGIRILNTTPAIRNCVIANNSSSLLGGGINAVVSTGRLLFDGCWITNNTVANSGAYTAGGGVYLDGSAVLNHCTISGNQSLNAVRTFGGGLFLQGADISLQNCTIAGNVCASPQMSHAAAVWMGSGALSMANCVVSSNTPGNAFDSRFRAALVVYTGGKASILNCTFIGNGSTAIFPADGPVNMTNSIVYFNNQGNAQFAAGNYGATIDYSDVQGEVWVGAGNTSVDPVLDPLTFELLSGSPCIDAGNPDAVFNDACFPPSFGPPQGYTVRNDMGAFGGPGVCDSIQCVEPTISSQPQGQKNCLGQSAIFCVGASGTPAPTYQWRFNDSPLFGQTSNCLVLGNLQITNAGSYAVVVSNSCGSVTSAVAQLVVSDACVDIHMYAGLNITGQQGSRYVVKYATDLSNTNFATWTPLATNTMSSSNWFFLDMDSPFSPRRFYGVKLLP